MSRHVTHSRKLLNLDSMGQMMQGLQEGSATHMQLMQDVFVSMLKANVEIIEVQQNLMEKIIESLETAWAEPPPQKKPAAPEKVKVK